MASGADDPTAIPMKESAYLAECTVMTPPHLVDFCWHIVASHRPGRKLSTIDLGAGDGRFSNPNQQTSYLGVDIALDQPERQLGPSALLRRQCASTLRGEWEVCIGNPPFLRHHAIRPEWRDAQRSNLQLELGVRIGRLANLYVYFIFYALRATAKDGLVALLVPFDWFSRPSGAPIRDYVREHDLAVDVYRISNERHHFPQVYTTLSLLVIDKARRHEGIQLHDADIPAGQHRAKTPAKAAHPSLLPFARLNRGSLHAFRGFSPGSQAVFTLTEEERTGAGIGKDDVVPCVTTLRHVPAGFSRLTKLVFQKRFVEAGAKCWLLKTDPPSKAARRWLERHKAAMENNYTCLNRKVWFEYHLPPVPDLIYSSAFRKHPKILINSVGARVLGAVQGIATSGSKLSPSDIQKSLADFDFESRVVPMAKGMRKLEVGQVNGILSTLEAGSGRGQ